MSHTREGAEVDARVKNAQGGIRHTTGYPSPGCPWRALQDPLVAEVANTWSAYDRNLGPLMADPRAPRALVQGVTTFENAYRRTMPMVEKELRKNAQDDARRNAEAHRARPQFRR